MPTIFRDRVEIGGMVFNSKLPDQLGVRYSIDILDGWDDTAPPQLSSASFTYNDGIVLAPRSPLKEQYIEVGGFIQAPTELALERAKDLLKSNLAGDVDLRLMRFGPIPKAMDVKPSGGLEWPQTLRGHGDNAARFLMQVVAPWPYKESPYPKIAEGGAFSGTTYYRVYTNYKRTYGDSQSRFYLTDEPAPGVVVRPDNISIDNMGTAVGYPRIEIYGPLFPGTWEIVNENTNERQTFDIQLAEGTMLSVDNKNQTAQVGGESVEYFLRGSWLSLARGSNSFRLITTQPNTSAYFRVLGYDTYR